MLVLLWDVAMCSVEQKDKGEKIMLVILLFFSLFLHVPDPNRTELYEVSIKSHLDLSQY